jgi:D-arabinose 1-dehydrogenase-like Zn-dependent alcohol dehydrogenase
LIKEIAEYTKSELFIPDHGLIWTMDGVDGIIDTIASKDTLEIEMRTLKTQCKLVFLGVSTPKRFENTPHYFKELEIIVFMLFQ